MLRVWLPSASFLWNRKSKKKQHSDESSSPPTSLISKKYPDYEVWIEAYFQVFSSGTFICMLSFNLSGFKCWGSWRVFLSSTPLWSFLNACCPCSFFWWLRLRKHSGSLTMHAVSPHSLAAAADSSWPMRAEHCCPIPSLSCTPCFCCPPTPCLRSTGRVDSKLLCKSFSGSDLSMWMLFFCQILSVARLVSHLMFTCYFVSE